MKEVTMLEFRQNAEAIIRKIQQGGGMLLTYRGKPVLKLEPVKLKNKKVAKKNDSLLTICELSQQWDSSADSSQLTNDDIDRIVYGL